MKCKNCGKDMLPAPAKFDGEPTFVGYYPCQCSREVWLDCECRENGGSLQDHRKYCCG